MEFTSWFLFCARSVWVVGYFKWFDGLLHLEIGNRGTLADEDLMHFRSPMVLTTAGSPAVRPPWTLQLFLVSLCPPSDRAEARERHVHSKAEQSKPSLRAQPSRLKRTLDESNQGFGGNGLPA